MSTKKKPKKKSPAKLARIARTKALKEWSNKVRDRDKRVCAVCGRAEYLNAHHLIPKENFKDLQFEVDNGITVCPKCHKFGAYSFHKHPFWAVSWLEKNRPEQYRWVMEHISTSAV